MKTFKALLVVLFVAGLAASLAIAQPFKKPPPTTTGATTGTTTTTTTKPKCHQVELKGSATAGTITFAVSKANKGRSIVGSSATLAIPAGAKVKAKVCTTAGSSSLTLRDLHVEVRAAKK